jgi:hypothetical protein
VDELVAEASEVTNGEPAEADVEFEYDEAGD